MPHASHRVDLLLVPVEIERAPDVAAFETLVARWRAAQRLEQAVVGGCLRVRLDNPGRVALFANHQGGFRARCPDTVAPISEGFGRALTAWRAGAARELLCASCERVHELEEVLLEPPGYFGRFAVVFVEARTLDIDPGCRAELEAALGPMREVVRRVG